MAIKSLRQFMRHTITQTVEKLLYNTQTWLRNMNQSQFNCSACIKLIEVPVLATETERAEKVETSA